MNYCESCKYLFESSTCPECGSRNLRPVEDNDYCFLIECSSTYGKMLAEILENEKIPCTMIPSGNGTRSALGLNLENLQLFVPYQFYDRASDLHNYLKNDPTEKIKTALLDNREKWHVIGKFTEGKLKKKLRLPKDADLFRHCEEIVNNSEKILDQGSISSCPEGGHYLFVYSASEELTFNSATFELMYAKIRK